MGTKVGGVSTIIIYLALLSVFASAWANMYSASKDIISRQETKNSFGEETGGDSKLQMKDFNFLPSVEIINLDTSAIGQDGYQILNDG